MLNNTEDLKRLKAFPRVNIGQWPTPMEALELSSDQRIWIKRDDLCGHGRGGAKARKISHLVGHMLDESYDELITVAGNVTNVIYDILPVLDAHGLGHHLFIINEPYASAQARDEIFAGVREHVTLLGDSNPRVAWRTCHQYARSRARSRRPLLVLPGLSHPSAIAGNASGIIELVEQCMATGRAVPDTLYITVATASTIAGFLIAAHALHKSGAPLIHIRGAQIYEGDATLWAKALMRWTERSLKLKERVPTSRIHISDAQLQGGFGDYSEELATQCRELATSSGIAVDPIFGGKTWRVMQEELKDNPGSTPLYWHCGFTPEWEELTHRITRGSAR